MLLEKRYCINGMEEAARRLLNGLKTGFDRVVGWAAPAERLSLGGIEPQRCTRRPRQKSGRESAS